MYETTLRNQKPIIYNVLSGNCNSLNLKGYSITICVESNIGKMALLYPRGPIWSNDSAAKIGLDIISDATWLC